ncbi:MAG: serine hydrolase [Patescibacteria group bacterium]|nr:serine hydrolase [Patescibacteria group bacterium]
MKQQIVLIHGGNAYQSYEDYIFALKEKELTLERLSQVDWKKNLQEDLGEDFEVIAPRMPNAQNAKYLEWEIWFEKMIPFINDNVIFIGHSLGGIFLAKYLSEKKYQKKIKAVILVAAPYNSPEHHPLADFVITSPLLSFEEQSPKIIIFHSSDDTVVYPDNAQRYKENLPNAKLILLQGKGHFNDAHFHELLEEILSL